MNCKQAETLVAAYADGEVDALRNYSIKKHLLGCAGCAASYQSMLELRARIRTEVPYFVASPALQARVRAAVGAVRASVRPQSRPTSDRWRWLTGGVLAGCGGGGGSDLSTPAAAAKTYLTGVGNGDGKAACSALAPQLQQQALASAKASGLNATSCPALFAQVRAHLSAAQRRRFTDAKITKVSQSGNTATVAIAGASSSPTLTKTGGKWLITGGVGF